MSADGVASFLAVLLSASLNTSHFLFLGLVGYWVSPDATKRGSNASFLWVSGCAVFQPFVAGYLFCRSRIDGRPDSVGVQERLVGTFITGHFVTTQLWFTVRLTNVVASVTYPLVVELQYYPMLLTVDTLPGTLFVWSHGWARIRRMLGWVHEQEREAVQR